MAWCYLLGGQAILELCLAYYPPATPVWLSLAARETPLTDLPSHSKTWPRFHPPPSSLPLLLTLLLTLLSTLLPLYPPSNPPSNHLKIESVNTAQIPYAAVTPLQESDNPRCRKVHISYVIRVSNSLCTRFTYTWQRVDKTSLLIASHACLTRSQQPWTKDLLKIPFSVKPNYVFL